ncbi:MAG TPA: S53 family peptidase [Streptosporangiaceae bacterium]|nr:S53 family peptidase [Streptosporangiaceae bacterium]
MKLPISTPLGRLALKAGITVLASAALTLGPTAALAASAASTPTLHPASDVRHACAAPKAGHFACLAVIRTNVPGHAGLLPDATPAGYGPADLQSAYALPSSTAGSGQTVAIVDAFNDPNAAADLAVYRSQFGLPACTTANGCFRQVNQTGGTSLPRSNSGWAEEESLDVDMVSAICPLCHIILVEAKSATIANLGAAVNEAVKLGAKFVSNSYGGGESSTEASSDSSFYNHPGVAVTASSGDSGFGPQYPAASQFVTAVGGTSLTRASNTRGWTETVWNGAGSGCSAFEAKPSWQHDTGCARRTIADVSAVANPNTGVAVYDTFDGDSGFEVFGGTSVASPIIASVFALAGTPTAGTYPSSYPYSHTTSLNDVTSGSNGSCSPSYLCTAGTGYDGPTGLGTPNGTAAFHQ